MQTGGGGEGHKRERRFVKLIIHEGVAATAPG